MYGLCLDLSENGHRASAFDTSLILCPAGVT
jgi:hypothetical protein